MGSLGVAGELNHLVGWQVEHLLDLLANIVERLLALLGRATLSASHVAVTAAWNGLSDATGPDTNTVEGLADVDDDAHDLTIVLILESVADGGHHYVQPKLVDVDAALLSELV